MIRVTISVTSDQFINPAFEASLNAALPPCQPRYDLKGREFIEAYRALIHSMPQVIASQIPPGDAPMILREFDLPDDDALRLRFTNLHAPFSVTLSEVGA